MNNEQHSRRENASCVTNKDISIMIVQQERFTLTQEEREQWATNLQDNQTTDP